MRGHANRCATRAPFDEVTFVMVEYRPILKYRAAEVIAAASACDAARSLVNVRLLSAEVPLLPLKTCDRPATCKCIYRHFDDRRRKLPRREEHALNALMACTPGSSGARGAGGARATTLRGARIRPRTEIAIWSCSTPSARSARTITSSPPTARGVSDGRFSTSNG